ncbi:twin-arginine translocase TatA/TatE family subunit [Georgenia sp. Z1344]|uniref:twin-arginine translocase TatA/TatE family subunit n=1 Tax=Georgenia sp. Z1344 TaxID=3416706 RepID=UPI003CF3432B
MFRNGLQPMHILVLVVVILLVFGASRLPDIAASIGKSLKVFKKEVRELREDDDTPTGSGQNGSGQNGGGQDNAGQHNQGQYNGGQHNQGQYTGAQYNGGQYNQGQYNGGQYGPPQGGPTPGHGTGGPGADRPGSGGGDGLSSSEPPSTPAGQSPPTSVG